MEKWFREQAADYFTYLIEQWFGFFSQAGYARPRLRIKKMRSRWGSLSARGYINLNVALMQYPDVCIEAVVVHELCHLVHMNHGAGFKRLQAQLLPDWRQRKRHLERLAAERPCIFNSSG